MKFTKKNGGFTLVELIVVIAILAILAAIAVPAYSGYIQKANEAGDQQLLAAVNTAYAAACLENNEDMLTLGEKYSVKVTMAGDAGNRTIAAITPFGAANEDFWTYFGDNKSSAFKVINQLAFDNGVFVNIEDSTAHVALNYNGKTVYASLSDIEAYKGSAWNSLESADVLTLVGNVSDMATAIDNDTFLNMLGDPAYLDAAAAAIGVDPTEYADYVLGMAEDAAAAWKEKNPTATDAEVQSYQEQIGGQIMANNAILVAAQNSQAAGESIMGLLTKDGGASAKESIKATMVSDPAAGLSQAALAYGLYSSYMLDSDPDNFDPNAPMDFSAVLNTMDDPAFQEYLTNGNGQKDLEGYLGALNTVGSNSANGGLGADILVDGFNNDALLELMEQAMGN